MNRPVDNRRWKSRAGRSVLAVLLVALILTSAAGHSNAQTPVTVRLVGPTTAVVPGQPFEVTVLVKDAANLGAFEFELDFDAAVVNATVDDIQLGPFLGSTGRTTAVLRLASSPSGPGAPLFGAYSYGSAGGPNGSGVLATVAMRARAAGVSQLSVTGLKVTDVLGVEVQAIASAGSVTVTAARPLYLPLLRRNSSN